MLLQGLRNTRCEDIPIIFLSAARSGQAEPEGVALLLINNNSICGHTLGAGLI